MAGPARSPGTGAGAGSNGFDKVRTRFPAPGSAMRNRYVDSGARAVLCAFVFVFQEWLFLATKPSFLTTWPVADRIVSLFAAAMPFMLGVLALHALACLLAAIASRSGHERLAGAMLRVVPSLAVAAIGLMLVDNFTYTMFGWSVARSTIATIPLYWALVLAIVVVQMRKRPAPAAWIGGLAAGALALSGLCMLWLVQSGGRADTVEYRSARTGALPNIILFASDGVNADYTSAYGYARKTTPNLDRYLDRALVADNAFTNAAWTTGSLTSMLTGKYPTTTKVLFPPYKLEGKDSYESLPRILHELGYRTGQETVRYYADGPDLNFADAFDYANGRKLPTEEPGRFSIALQHPRMVGGQAVDRLSERILQLSLVERMSNPYDQVVSAASARGKGVRWSKASDADRMRRIVAFMTSGNEPFFAHIHLLGTHCCTYYPPRAEFSSGAFANARQRNEAKLADAVLESDRIFGEMMAMLERRGMLDNTVVVYTSDHDNHWEVRSRVPLVFIFPGGAHAGHVQGNSQLLDVAPTLLDHLKVDVPGWMEGASLLKGDIAPDRPVYAIYKLGKKKRYSTEDGDYKLGSIEAVGPPTYGLQSAVLVVCRRWYIMQLENQKIRSGKMARYRGKCGAGLPTSKEARAMLTRHLRDRGFVF
jgi:hypothetical protein